MGPSLISYFIFFSIFIGSNSLICYECHSKDARCAENPVHNKTCEESVNFCYTFHEEGQFFDRGCADPNDTVWSTCIKSDYMGCSYCRDDYCNVQKLSYSKRNIFCVTSKEPSHNLKDVVPLRCEGSIPIGSSDYCYYFVSKNAKGEHDVIDRGCYPFKGQVNADSALFYCKSNGCNSYITHSTYMFCYTLKHALNLTLENCQSPRTNFPGLCFVTVKHEKRFGGCLSQLKSFPEVQACAYKNTTVVSQKKDVCQTCDRRYCLRGYPLTRKYYTNKCGSLSGKIVCSQFTAKCFIHLTGNNITLAGCVEPGLSHTVMTHINTLFCSNEDSGYTDSCFDVKANYSGALGCYSCLHCEDPESLTSEDKTTCYGEMAACYTYSWEREKLVSRGCTNNSTRLKFNCTTDPTCYTCNTNYCNGNRPIRNDLKCYTSKPFGYDHHSTTLQLESCNGNYHKVRNDKCYLAEHKKTMAISAGCIEDAPKVDTVYMNWISGQTSIIFEGVRSACYKCKSRTREHCFNVGRLQAESCSGSGQYAVRGCYTYFSRYDSHKIERGCMSELDPYLQSLCLMPHFEELCVTCRDNACNSHVRSEN